LNLFCAVVKVHRVIEVDSLLDISVDKKYKKMETNPSTFWVQIPFKRSTPRLKESKIAQDVFRQSFIKSIRSDNTNNFHKNV